MKVGYVDHMGSDLSVVNAARVSFNKLSTELSLLDGKLIKYLAEHGHWSPFAHTSISLRVKAPIFVARQLVKHQVGLTWNEVSRRYVKTEPSLFWPEKWRKAAENVKQGSSDKEFNAKDSEALQDACENALRAQELYISLVSSGLCPEQARMFLPQNAYTEWIWTGSVYAFARVYNQRTHPTAQQETKEVALMIGDVIKPLFPVSWKVLTKE